MTRDDNVRRWGAAMVGYIHRTGVPHRIRPDGSVVFVPWWRSDETEMKGRLWPRTAGFHDAATGERGGAKRFAALAGMSLDELVARSPGASIWHPTAAAQSPPLDLTPLWNSLPTAVEVSAVLHWLEWDRGFGELAFTAAALAGGLASLRDGHALGISFPFSWNADSPALVLPLKSLRDGRARNLSLRPLCVSRPKYATLSGLGVTNVDGTPLAYGLASEPWRARAIILVEGAMDMLAVSSLLANHHGVLVVGAHSTGSLVKSLPLALSELAPQASYLIVPHLDEELDHHGRLRGAGMNAASGAFETFTKRTVDVQVFDWLEVFRRADEAPATRVADVADAFRVWGWREFWNLSKDVFLGVLR
jgi:hypothetical protein